MRIEYLIVTKQEEGFCDSKEAFIKLLEANSQIKISKDKLEFNDGSSILEIDFLVETDQIKDEKQRYFHLKLNCKDESRIGELTKITRIIKAMSTKLNISNSEISTLWDDISIYYATQSYPLINEIENLMRNLILKFMIVNVGMDWSNKVVPKDVKQKITNKEKINSEQTNFRLADKLHNADFIVLSEFLFEKYRNKEVGQLDNLISSKKPEDKISFEDLKKDYFPVSNWDRYFSDLIKYKGEILKSQWDKLYELRNKVAHNKTIEKKDFDEIKNLTSIIKPKLEEAINNLAKVELTPEQKEILIQQENGETPLHQAASRGDLEEVKILIANGADVNAKEEEWGDTPLHHASFNGHLNIVRLLIQNGAEINAKEKWGNTPLHWASMNNHFAIVEYLLANGANVNANEGFGDGTPLHCASSRGHLETVKVLVINGANVNAKDGSSTATPLLQASEAGQLEIAKYLIEKGANVNIEQQGFGSNPLCAASKVGNIAIVKLLIENEANIT